MSKGECSLPEVLAQAFPKVFILPMLTIRVAAPHQRQALQGKVDKAADHESECSSQECDHSKTHATV